MMAHARIHENLNTGLWSECAATATKLENIMINLHGKKVHMKRSMKKFQTMVNTLGLLEKW